MKYRMIRQLEAECSGYMHLVEIRERKGKLVISCWVTNWIEDMAGIHRLHNHMAFGFNTIITLTLNLSRGRAYISVSAGSGQAPFFIYDLTNASVKTLELMLPFRLIAADDALHQLVVAFFERHWEGRALPFSEEEGPLSPDNYIAMTRFVGYPLEFYYAIPYSSADAENRIDGSFRSMARKLHRASDVPGLYSKLGLPKQKSLRRIILGNDVGLLWYASEIKALTEVISDPNLLHRILSGENNIWKCLQSLHDFPSLISFYGEFDRVCGKKALVRNIESCLSLLNQYGLRYCSLDRYHQGIERKNWRSSTIFRERPSVLQTSVGSLPGIYFHSPDNYSVRVRIRNSVIDGYSFRWLHGEEDYHRAGKLLQNCLSETGACSVAGSVLVVEDKNQKPLAAIEVALDRIVQAYAYRNEFIDRDSPLGQAITQWCSAHSVTWPTYSLDEDFDYYDPEEWYNERFG